MSVFFHLSYLTLSYIPYSNVDLKQKRQKHQIFTPKTAGRSFPFYTFAGWWHTDTTNCVKKSILLYFRDVLTGRAALFKTNP